MSLFAMSIGPYINASIIMQMMTLACRSWKRFPKRANPGRKQIAKIHALPDDRAGLRAVVRHDNDVQQSGSGIHPLQRILICIALTAGSSFLLWMGEQVTQHGVGNGVSLVIFAGILLSLPYQFSRSSRQVKTGTASWFSLLLLIAAFVAMTYCCRLYHAGNAANSDPAYQARYRHAADAGRRLVPADQSELWRALSRSSSRSRWCCCRRRSSTRFRRTDGRGWLKEQCLNGQHADAS